jgi:hypothetical protein
MAVWPAKVHENLLGLRSQPGLDWRPGMEIFTARLQRGGANGFIYGTVFSLSVGLSPFVATNPNSGKVGAA